MPGCREGKKPTTPAGWPELGELASYGPGVPRGCLGQVEFEPFDNSIFSVRQMWAKSAGQTFEGNRS